MLRIVCLAILVVRIATGQVEGPKVLRDVKASGLRDVLVLGRTDEAQLKVEAVRWLGSPEVTLGRVVIFPSEPISRMRYRETQTSCMADSLRSFLARNSLEASPLRCPQLSEAIKIGADLLVRTVHPDCNTSKAVVLGKDPLSLELRGGRVEIVAISTGVIPNSMKVWGAEYPRLRVFVRTHSELRTELGEQVTAVVKNMSGAREIFVYVRNDSQFEDHCGFQSPFLFGGPELAFQEKVPQVDRAPQVACYEFYPNPVRCWKD